MSERKSQRKRETGIKRAVARMIVTTIVMRIRKAARGRRRNGRKRARGGCGAARTKSGEATREGGTFSRTCYRGRTLVVGQRLVVMHMLSVTE